MKKLKLDLEELEVNSFEIDAESAERGTVRGNADTELCSYTCTDPLSAIYRYFRKWTTTGAV